MKELFVDSAFENVNKIEGIINLHFFFEVGIEGMRQIQSQYDLELCALLKEQLYQNHCRLLAES